MNRFHRQRLDQNISSRIKHFFKVALNCLAVERRYDYFLIGPHRCYLCPVALDVRCKFGYDDSVADLQKSMDKVQMSAHLMKEIQPQDKIFSDGANDDGPVIDSISNRQGDINSEACSHTHVIANSMNGYWVAFYRFYACCFTQ